MCVTFEEQQFPVGPSCKTRQVLCSCCRSAGLKLGQDRILGSFSRRWNGEKGKVGRSLPQMQDGFHRRGWVFNQSWGGGAVKLTTEANYCSSCPICPKPLSQVTDSVAAKQLVKLHWTTAVVHVKSLQFTAGILQPVNKGRLSLPVLVSQESKLIYFWLLAWTTGSIVHYA